MARKKPYSPEQMATKLNVAAQGLRSINQAKAMLLEQLGIQGADGFMRWMDQHGFWNDFTCCLMDLKRDGEK